MPLGKHIAKNWRLYMFLVIPIIYYLVFRYIPMFGNVIAFRKYRAGGGIFGVEWSGFKYFRQFIRDQMFWRAFANTLRLNIIYLLFRFPLTLIFALLLNEIKNIHWKKFVQTVSYLPHFISVVVMSGMIILFLSPSTGIIAKLVGLLGFTLPNLMGSASAFPHIYVWTEAWQHVGWDSILYIATLSSVDPSLYEAATMDGANKWHKIVNIDLPSLVPTATVMFILRMGSVMSVGFEKVYLLQNNLNSSSSEIISTYVYKMGLVSNQYSLSAAIGLFNNIINLVLLIAVNLIAKKVSDTSLV